MKAKVAHYGLKKKVQNVHILIFKKIPINDGQIWYYFSFKNPCPSRGCCSMFLQKTQPKKH